MVMLFSSIALLASYVFTKPTSHSLKRREITQDLLDEFTRFTNFSVGAYQESCPSPLGNTLVVAFNNEMTDTQGYITRDDTNKQIITVFRGSQQVEDFLTDLEIKLVPFSSPGVSSTSGAEAHVGFLDAYNSVASTVLSNVVAQLDAHPDYSLISTGHSLGASIASIAGISLASNFHNSPLRVFTFGQPRTGNPAYAQLAENLIGAENIFRAVHTFDGVPTIIPQLIGYRHHETEFWNFQDPSIPENVKQCTGEEDPTCSDSIPSTGINLAHVFYFGQVIGVGVQPFLCE